MLNSPRNTHLIETSYDRLKSREITFQQYEKILLKAGIFRWVTNIHEHKDITIPLIIHYYLLRAFRTLHKSFHAKSVTSVSSVSAPGRWHNAIRVRAKPCVHRLVFPGHSREVPVRAVDIVVREYNDDSSPTTYDNKY